MLDWPEKSGLVLVGTGSEHFTGAVKKLGSAQRKRHVADVEVFKKLLEMMLGYKECAGIVNSSTAFLTLIELAEREILNSRD